MREQIELEPGDVLLFYGKGFISWGIRKFDGTDVNHAAIALNPKTLAEAGGRGLQRTPIAKAVGSNVYMRVRRHSDQELAPVITVATSYVDEGRPYAYQQIVLLALLATTRRIKLTGAAKRMLRSILDHAAAALNAFMDRDGSRSMICSEFVYRAYREAIADPAERYRILVQVGDAAFDPTVPSLTEWALQQPDELFDTATGLPASFDVAASVPRPDLADDAAEMDLAPLMASWALESGLVDEDMPPAPPPAFSPQGLQEPSDEELLASLISFSTAFVNAESEEPPSFGAGTAIGSRAARGAIQGLLRPDIEANFVTPGDLLLSPTLADVGTIRAGA